MDTLAKKIDGTRGTRDISSSLNHYKKLRSTLKDKSIPADEKKKIVGEMEKRINLAKKNLPKDKHLKEWNEISKKFENALKKDREKAKKLYADLRNVYVKVIEKKIGDARKKELYKKMDKYYKKLQNSIK